MTSSRRLGIVLLTLATACGSSTTGPSPVTAPDVLVSGTIHVPGTYEIDLETGTLQTDDTADIWNEVVTDDEVELSTDNNAKLVLMGANEPDYATCASANYAQAPVELIGLATNSYFCVMTDQGRIARIEITTVPTVAEHAIDVAYTTWKLAS
jgi:hypothetical protein